MATGVGGLLGSLIGGVITQYYHPKYGFLIYSFMGIAVSINGFFLTKASEEDAEDVEQLNLNESATSIASTASQSLQRNSFSYKLNQNFKQIGVAMMMPEIYLVIFYFLASGILNPDFGDFGYYYMMNVCKITKFQYSLMGVIG